MSRVLIVGAGPIGLFLAVSLKQYNVDISIIDKINPERDKFSKALTITSASLKAFHGLGIAQNFLEQGRKVTGAKVFFNKKKVLNLNKHYLNSLYNFYLSIPQPETESILEQKLNSYSTDIEYQQELIDIVQCKDYVEVTIKNLKTLEVEKKHFDFVIGCDGAHSSVRKILKIPFIGHDYDLHFILGDVFFREKFSFACATYYVDEAGFVGFFPKEDGATRIVIGKKGQRSDSIIKPIKEDFQPYLNSYLPNSLNIRDLLWSSCARVTNRMAQSMRVNRVLLVGDACHLFSSVGGQTMNTGIQDSFDLGWRLAHYLNNNAKEELLDGYAQDRKLAANKVFALTDLYTKLIMGNIKHEKIKYFQPNFSNRKFYKMELPNEFAGYMADYSCEEKGIVGKHIPYIKFQKPYDNLISTYDLPQLQKHVLFRLGDSAQSTEAQELALYSDVVTEIIIGAEEKTLSNELQIDKQNACMVSPAGYIVVHGKLAEVKKYLKNYYHG